MKSVLNFVGVSAKTSGRAAWPRILNQLRRTAALGQTLVVLLVAPMTDPDHGAACAEHRAPSTPAHYSVGDDLKRSFQLGHVLIDGGQLDEGIKIMNAALDRFRVGPGGMDGVRAAEPSALMLTYLK